MKKELLSADHPGRRPPGPPIIAGPDPVTDIEALVLEIYDYIITGRLPQRKNV